jgi:hypothetical protein
MTQNKDIFINPESDEITVNMEVILTPTTLVENTRFRVQTTGHDYDIIAVVQNLTEKPLCLKLTGEAEWLGLIAIAPNAPIGLLADTEGYSSLEALVNGRYEYQKGE